jgi:hypothetical protein
MLLKLLMIVFALAVPLIMYMRMEPMTNVSTMGRTLPQVDALGRGIEEKVASDHNAKGAYTPDLNALFESLSL